ncbi:MAG: NAD(P)-dependent oxidoreductase [Campylobacteraceae bacterium]|nr:NAD(P)-dependent oxidoreductase [Campylobacteraceae bacterium]
MNQPILQLASNCLECKKPKCRPGCPIDTPIPEMIHLFLNGNIQEAGKILFENNHLSVICSLVCPHEKHCEGHCILNKKGAPVSVGAIEHYISSNYLMRTEFEKAKPNGKSVAIIGSGPAGMGLAFLLAKKGYDITIYDKNDKVGGVLRYGIPSFRLDKSILDTLIEKLKNLGVKIRPNVTIGKYLTIENLFRDGFDAVFIGTGVWAPKLLNIKGESLGNVHFAIDYLKNPDVHELGNKVVVLGAGNVAMDVARTAVRKGVKEVRIMYRRGEEDMPASKHEIQCTKLDGVFFDFYRTPYEITTDGIHFIQNNESGFETADSVLIAISQNPKDVIVSNNKGIAVDKQGLVLTDDHGHTTQPGVFASGDVVTGARTVVEAVALSKKVASAIESYLLEKEFKVKS